MIQLAERAKLLKPSPILMLAARAGELKAEGKNVISLSIGEPDWDTYGNIKEAAIRSIKEGKTKYTPANGIPELRKAIIAQTEKDLGIKYDISQVTVSSGAKFVLFSALQAIVNAGDEVILVAPFWASYTTMVELAQGIPKIAVCGEDVDFKLTPAILKAAITPKTKAILLNSPSNPTGKVYSASELKGLAEVLRLHPNIAIISDDIYNRLSFDSKIAPHLLQVAPDLKDRVIILNGASKSYSMTGWRLGWALGPKEIMGAMTAYQSQSVSCASATSQWAAIEAINGSDADVTKTVEHLKKRRDFLVTELKKIPGMRIAMPEGAFYLWVSCDAYQGKQYKGKTMHTSADISLALLDDQLVAAVPGVEFGLDGYLRLCYTLENDKGKEACDRMAKFFGSCS
jgi:aspartate aminotransferase